MTSLEEAAGELGRGNDASYLVSPVPGDRYRKRMDAQAKMTTLVLVLPANSRRSSVLPYPSGMWCRSESAQRSSSCAE